MKVKAVFKGMLCVVLSVCICVFAFYSVYKRADECLSLYEGTALMAAFAVLPDADKNYEKKPEEKPSQPAPKADTQATEQPQKIEEETTKSDERTYKVSEIHLSSGEISYNDFFVNNNTSYDMDIKALLDAPLGFEFDSTRQAQVLIVHTHTCESYMSEDTGYYYESFYPRSTDNSTNVVAVGEKIAQSLKAHGIGVVHAKEQHDNPSYDGAYDRSYDTIQEYMSKYKEIKVVLDIHRDSMTADDMTRYKPTFTYNGQKAAQIMIMTGHDDGDGDFACWEQNLNFALKLQDKCESKYKGMTRPLNFGEFTYNMNVNSGSLLIEVGTDANTLDEALLTGEMLGNALAEVLQKQ